MTLSVRRRFPLAVAMLTAVAVLLGVAIAPDSGAAWAAPGTPPGGEGGTPLLRDVLEATGRGYLQAKNRVENSRKRQLQLGLELQKIEGRVAGLAPEIGQIAATSYRIGRIGPMSMLLNSSSSNDFLERAAGLELIAMRHEQKLRALKEAREQAERAKLAIDNEVQEEQKQLTVMAKQKQEAERALKLVGGISSTGFVSATSPIAKQAPRNPDGSWPAQSCSVNDPTTSGCITPRLLHALRQTQAAGFKRFVSCYRPGGPYEHPKGRACDFSPQKNGFGGDAMGEERLYGNNLAAFLVRNADRLGVLYVIWYRQVWLPATGWKSYSGAHGDPSSDHTNHVHLSVL